MNRNLVLLLTLIGVFAPSISFAQVSGEQSPMDRILDQKKLERQQQKLFEKPKTKERKKVIKKGKRTSNYCIEIKKVEFLKATKLSKKAKKNLTEKVLNKCIYNEQIGELLGDITNYYIGDGYTNARGYFKGYNENTGTITLLISEGIINSIKLNDLKPKDQEESKEEKPKDIKKEKEEIGSSFFDKTQIFFAFPTRKGRIFNITNIEQGVANMNRLRSNNTVIDSRPGSINGTSDVIVNNYKNPNSLELGITYDNTGSKSTGVYNAAYSISKDNALHINDNIGFSQIKSSRSETNMINVSIPFGYYNFSYMDSSNKYTAFSGGIKVEGTSTNHDFSLSRLLYRDKKHEVNLNTNLNFRNQTRKEAGIIRLSSQRLSTGRVGFDYKTNFKNGLTIYTGFTYSKGLKIHGSINDKKDFSSLTKDTPRAQFEKFSYNLNLYKSFGKYLNYSLQANGQHSSDSLYSSELLYVGGSKYTVRGFQYDGVSGSKGGYARNELNLNLASILGKFDIKQDKEKHHKFTNKAISILQSTQPFIFYDHGFTRAVVRSDEDKKNEYISGTGFGIKYYGKYINFDASYSASLNAPDFVIENNEYQNSAIYFGISGRYWLW